MARHAAHGLQHALVTNAAVGELLPDHAQPAAEKRVVLVVLGHCLPIGSRSEFFIFDF
jgi:hypothetical protein